MEELFPNLYRIQIPLPKNPLKSLNSYVIKGEDRNLIVDTGFNRPECLEAMEEGLKEIGVDLEITDFFVTHLHADHLGLVSTLARKGSKVYFNRPEAEIIEGEGGWEQMFSYAGLVGFPEKDLRSALQNHPGKKFSGDWSLGFNIVQENYVFALGGYEFRCLETPGHTRGHICLYEPSRKILISGDHILGDITPNIQLWSDKENSLQDYLDSLDKIDRLEVDLVLPGHRSLVQDCKKRIKELKDHHHRRADEVIEILRSGRKNAYEIAAGMTWDIQYDSWDTLAIAQRWFATGEAISHIKYVQDQGLVKKIEDQGKILFELA